MKISEKIIILAEGKSKPFFGKSEGMNFAVNIDGVDNEFPTYPFGRRLDDLKKIKDWKSDAKKGYANAKGKPTLAAVKKHVKDQGYKEFFATWKADSDMYKDDSVEIFYKK